MFFTVLILYVTYNGIVCIRSTLFDDSLFNYYYLLDTAKKNYVLSVLRNININTVFTV